MIVPRELSLSRCYCGIDIYRTVPRTPFSHSPRVVYMVPRVATVAIYEIYTQKIGSLVLYRVRLAEFDDDVRATV